MILLDIYLLLCKGVELHVTLAFIVCHQLCLLKLVIDLCNLFAVIVLLLLAIFLHLYEVRLDCLLDLPIQSLVVLLYHRGVLLVELNS